MIALRFKYKSTLPMILQQERTECGHACVAMLSNFWGHDLNLHTIRNLSQPSARGITMRDMHEIFASLNINTRALRVSIAELHLIKCPAILHWDMNHFVILKQVKHKSVIIHDPAIGVRKCSLDEVAQSFTGIVMEAERGSDFKMIREKKTLRLWDFVRVLPGMHYWLGLLLLLSIGIELLNLCHPLFLQYITDSIIGSGIKDNIYIMLLGFSILIMIHGITDYLRSQIEIYFTNHLNEQLATSIVQHLLKLPLSFFEQRHKGDLQSKFHSITQIQKKLSTDLLHTLLDGLIVMVTVSIMFLYSAKLTVVVVTSLFIYCISRYLASYALKKDTESSLHRHAKTASIFLETLAGIIPIKSFQKETIRFNTWRNCYINSLNADIRIAKSQSKYQILQHLITNIDHMIILWLGASLVITHKLSAGMFMAALSYRLILINKATAFIQNIFDYKLLHVQLDRLSDIVLHPNEIDVRRSQCVLSQPINLTLKNLAFRYSHTDNYVFHQLNLQIKAGEKIAIIGPSGCGKSTLLKVMMGLLVPTSGQVLPLHHIGIQQFRALSASVMQEDTLLSGSITDNITFFADVVDHELMYHVAKLAEIHEQISILPMGYETLVGDMGLSLSGGQKQRILLARALYKKPKILFLDEATSHLDAECELKINNSLKSLDITQIIIAHRQETIRMVDRVIDLGALNKKLHHD